MSTDLAFDLAFLLVFVSIVTVVGLYAQGLFFRDRPFAATEPEGAGAARASSHAPDRAQPLAHQRAGVSRDRHFFLKSCPRCAGDLAPDRQQGEGQYTCLQCGWSGALTERRSHAGSAR
jgi:hypothetical protein